MKVGKLSLAAIATCIAFANPASAQITSVVNICEVKPDGSVHTVKVSTLSGGMNYTHYFTNITTQQTFVRTGTGFALSRTFALNPGTYTLKYGESVSNNPTHTYPNTIVVRPYTFTGGKGTGCVLTKIGDKAERVPTTPLPQ